MQPANRLNHSSLTALVLAAALGSGSSTAAQAARPGVRPVAVSPGSATGALIGEACPTFSWGAVPEARGYDLVVYDLSEGGEAATPVLRQRISGLALSWTPSLELCLARGGQYAWSVRAVGRKAGSDWSVPSLFEVAAGPSEAEFEAALEVVKSYLTVERRGVASVSAAQESTPGKKPQSPQSNAAPGTRAAPAATQLSVNGNIDATSFTGDGENLANVTTDAELATHAGDATAHHQPPTSLPPSGDAGGDLEGSYPNPIVGAGAVGSAEIEDGTVAEGDLAFDPATQAELDALAISGECEGYSIAGRRYVDRGDGTVRDCNTGKIWLKDVGCMGWGTWDESVQKVADLNSGTDFGCAGYTAGTYTDWEVPAMVAMCGLWDGSCKGTSCCTASQGLVDVSVPGVPKVVNGKGDATWTQGNVFVDVLGVQLWSATEVDANKAWYLVIAAGYVDNFHNKDKDYRVWAVRAGQ